MTFVTFTKTALVKLPQIKNDLKMKKYSIILALFFFVIHTTFAQHTGRHGRPGEGTRIEVSGKIVDSKNKKPIFKVNVLLMNMADSMSLFSVTSESGNFRFNVSTAGTYELKATYIGYKELKKQFQISGGTKNLGVLKMTLTEQQLSEVNVEGKIPMAVIQGDTTVYNADAFKVNPDANAEDLIRKMPGIVVEDGKVTAHGEDVKEVLVDGKNFFGYDPTLALRSLPAEIIEKIQVFDKQSDQAKFTGFDDGQETKAINIITRSNMRNGQFGNVYAGYGADNEYAAGGRANVFSGKRRISVIGQSNNINQQNFSTQDLLGVVGTSGRRGRGMKGGGGGGRPGGGGGKGGSPGGGSGGGADISDFIVGKRNGISTTHSLGINYSDSWGKKANLTGSYFFNQSDNRAIEELDREYFLEGGNSSFYNENSVSNSANYNHRLNMMFELNIDSANAFIIRPRLSFQTNNSDASLFGINSSPTDDYMSETNNLQDAKLNGYNFSNNLLYRHKFGKKGRTFSVNLNIGMDDNNGDMYQNAPGFATDELVVDTINQHSDLLTKGYSLGSRIMYTEPIGENSMLQLNYSVSYAKSDADRMTYNYNESMQDYDLIDTLLSNTFDNNYITQVAGLGYRWRFEKNMFMAGVGFQLAELAGEQFYPDEFELNRTFKDVLPMLMYNYRLSRKQSLRIMYRTSTRPPSIDQMQDVIDNSNALQLSTGNPYLKQEYNHRLFFKYNKFNTEDMTTLFLYVSGEVAQNHIGNSTFFAYEDTLLYNKILLEEGGQLIRPENMDGYFNIRSLVSYGVPVYSIKSNLNFNAAINYNRMPGLINGFSNNADNYGLNLGLAISSNISEKIDFTVSTSAAYNIVKNSMQKDMDYNYYSQSTFAKFTWMTTQGIVLRNELNMKNYKGLDQSYDPDYYLWNVSLGKKLFKNQFGEIQLKIFDILNQNKSIKRNVTELYVEDSSSNVLQRFFMLTFSYKFRNFNY